MNEYIPFNATDKFLTVTLDGKPYTMSTSNPNWNRAIEALKRQDKEELLSLFDTETAIVNFSEGQIEIKDNKLFYGQEELHGHVIDRLFDLMEQGLNFKPLARFIAKLQDNPSNRSVEELYNFLEHKQMPLTEDGNFLAYKGVNSEYKDRYSGTVDNSVGQVCKMARNQVSDNANDGCSAGLHAGTYDYANGYASGGGHLMLVEINPAHVVSVPHDCSCQKLRTSEYKVVEHCKTIIKQPVYDYGYDEDDIDEDDYGYLNEQDVNENSAGDVYSVLMGLKKSIDQMKNQQGNNPQNN